MKDWEEHVRQVIEREKAELEKARMDRGRRPNPELEDYPKDMFEGEEPFLNFIEGTRVRKDLRAMDASKGIRIKRIGAYRAGAGCWDGRARNNQRYYDSDGDYFLEFDNGKRLECVHDPDCCGDNYADFPDMQVMGVQAGNSVRAEDLTFFDDILNSIIPIKDLGFYLVTTNGLCILVPCYSVQNGYYSSDLTLKYDGKCISMQDGGFTQWLEECR